MSSAMFDPNALLDSTIEGSNDTKMLPVPAAEYTGIIDSIKGRTWESKDKSTQGVALDVFWAIDDQAVRDLFGRDKVVCKQSLMLDMTDGGALDMGKGKNVGLGRLREATGTNRPGQPFAFAQLVGQLALVKVEHRQDLNDAETVYAEIKRVAKLG